MSELTSQRETTSNLSPPAFRVGIGYDSHRLVEGRPLILGGVAVPFEKGLQGHSDADVLLHAISDALCGAASLPDIGQLFPDTDPQWQGVDSWKLLQAIAERARSNGWQIGNVDAVLIAQRPKIAPFVPQMRQRIAQALSIEVGQVNVRGKTAEGLGALGEGLGMEAHAVCLVQEAAPIGTPQADRT
jgi:2-C-methyl-D-erythritol 2,4-cyclodiphosphate synthase